jgi:hypothetical protein
VRKKKKRGFFQGLLCGMGLLAGFLLLSGALFLNRGVQVHLDSGDIAASVGAQVTWYAERDLPRMIEEAKAEIPEIVRKEMEGALTSTRMEIAGFIFTLPDELAVQLEGFLRENVENSVYRLLDGIDTRVLSREIGETAALLVQQQMQEYLHGQTFHIRVLGPVNLPVTVFIREIHE